MANPAPADEKTTFRPDTTLVVVWCVVFLALSGGAFLFWLWFGGALPLCAVALAVILFLIFLYPLLRDQVVEVGGGKIALRHHGRKVELGKADLVEIVERGKDVLSYRFEKGGFQWQITPAAYVEDEEMRKRFKEIFRGNAAARKGRR